MTATATVRLTLDGTYVIDGESGWLYVGRLPEAGVHTFRCEAPPVGTITLADHQVLGMVERGRIREASDG